MKHNFSYQSDDYDRQTQKFVVPLYIEDDLKNYNYSSTGTLVKYNGHHYIIFAAHALTDNETIDNICLFLTSGEFIKIRENAIGYQIFKDEDIVLVDFFNQYFEGKNYFNLNETHLNGFEKQIFAWTGFPASKSKSKKVHHTKSNKTLQNQYVVSDITGDYFTNANYFTILSRLIKNNEKIITGKYNRENMILKYKGKVTLAPYPAGMSGGAMYFFAEGQTLRDNLDDTFRFAGIGIEYNRNDNTIVGVSREKIINLLEQFDKDNPLLFHLVDRK